MQLGLPTVPTDNLYKFMALFGLLFSATLFIYTDYKANQARDELIKYSKISKERLHELIEGYAKGKPNLDMKLLHEKYSDLDHSDGLRVIVFSKDFQYYMKLRNWISPFLLLISVAGFVLWYLKVQRYQDRILKNEASKS